MSDADNSGHGSGASSSEDGVLANLPPTRPQRTSRRRTEARTAGSRAKTGAPGRAGARGSQGSGAQERARQKGTRERRVGPRLEPAASKRSAESGELPGAVPKQGFESEGDASGPVQPPGGMELVASGAEIVVELARAGLSAGERLLGDLVGRLPRP